MASSSLSSSWTFSNTLSLLRAPLALFFLLDSPLFRCLAISLAMASDYLDGYLARRLGQTSQFGAMLDPLMDKFFVAFAFAVFIHEGRLDWLETGALICRDFAVILFGLYLHFTGNWARYQFRAIWCGKVTTLLQFLVLFCLSVGGTIPGFVFALFIALGVFALIELYLMARPLLR